MFVSPVTEPPVPWALKQPGFRVDRVATGFQLPVNIAFVPEPGTAPDEPLFYVTELYGTVKVVSNGGAVSDYATNLLNFDPVGSFPGAGEKGLAGIVVEPASGDVFVSSIFAVSGVSDFHFPEVRRLHSEDGGRTAASQTAVLQFPDEPMGASHQTSNLTIGPDGKLYVHIGDGLLTTPAQDLNSVRGQDPARRARRLGAGRQPLLRRGRRADGEGPRVRLGAAQPVWRRPGATSTARTGRSRTGPGTDRLAKIVAGRNYLWDGSNSSMDAYAAYLWTPSHAPVNIAFTQLSTFAGSRFPADRMNHAFVTESGATYAPGPQESGKRIVEFVLDADGNLVSGPLPLVEYLGSGRGTAVALAAGPDGLYFSDLYKNFGASTPTERGASVFRIAWTGVADFTAETVSGAGQPRRPVPRRVERARPRPPGTGSSGTAGRATSRSPSTCIERPAPTTSG